MCGAHGIKHMPILYICVFIKMYGAGRTHTHMCVCVCANVDLDCHYHFNVTGTVTDARRSTDGFRDCRLVILET